MLDSVEIAGGEMAGRLSRQIGEALRNERQRQKLTLVEIAERCNTSPQTIQRLETAIMTLSVDWVERLCTALSIAPIQLFDVDRTNAKLRRRIQRMEEEGSYLRLRCIKTVEQIDAFLEGDGE